MYSSEVRMLASDSVSCFGSAHTADFVLSAQPPSNPKKIAVGTWQAPASSVRRDIAIRFIPTPHLHVRARLEKPMCYCRCMVRPKCEFRGILPTAEVTQGHVRAFVGQCRGDFEPQPPRPTGNQRDAAVDAAHELKD